MISMGAESAVVLSPGQITDIWDNGLKNLEAVYHQTGNLKIDVIDEKAVAFCYGTASHYKKTNSGKNTRIFIGSYDFHLTKTNGEWRIDSFKFNLKCINGNLNLENE